MKRYREIGTSYVEISLLFDGLAPVAIGWTLRKPKHYEPSRDWSDGV